VHAAGSVSVDLVKHAPLLLLPPPLLLLYCSANLSNAACPCRLLLVSVQVEARS
jgi:hypothetical protein